MSKLRDNLREAEQQRSTLLGAVPADIEDVTVISEVRVSGARTMRTLSRLSRSTMAAGVPAGANRPVITSDSKSGSPAAISVGRPGASSVGRALATADDAARLVVRQLLAGVRDAEKAVAGSLTVDRLVTQVADAHREDRDG